MYERTMGSKYDADLDVKEIAKRIRAAIKDAVKTGAIPTCKASVKIQRYSGGQSVNVTVTSAEFSILNPAQVKWQNENPHEHLGVLPVDHEARERHTGDARDVLAFIEAEMATYNYDRSEPQADYFDVNFYGHATFDWELENAERDAIVAEATGQAVTA